ncbi:MAG: hypothetical protein EP329_16580 [Deltaproteobacteria bacterium]|nr:MAG: hypothetical protein EP329_16580 [Deltaproteobacteria bacterium]
MSRPLAMILALGAVTVSLAALAADASRREEVSTDAAVDQAVEVVRSRFAPGDGVVTQPFWDRAPWQRLVDAGPGAERYPYPALLRSERPDPVALLTHQRLWVLGLDGRRPEPPESVREVATPVDEVAIDAQTTVALWALPRLTPLRTLTEDFNRLEVGRRLPDGKLEACPRKGDRHRCGREPWFDLHRQDRDVYHQDVSWLFAHPGPGDIALEIGWPDLPGGTWLVLRAGFTQAGVRHDEGKDVTVRVEIDGAEAGSFVLAPHVYWLGRGLYAIPAGPGKHAARITIQTPEHGWRELMMQADVFAEVPEVLRRWADETP